MKRIYTLYLIVMLVIITGCVMVLKDQAHILIKKEVETNGIIVDNRIIIDTVTKE